MKVSFTILGEPVGKGRPRFRKAGPFTQPYTPIETESYENLIKVEYRRQCHDFKFEKDVPLDLRITAYLQIPDSTSKRRKALIAEKKIRPTKKPDQDNINKIVCDALNKIAYHDDSQIVDSQIRKFYSFDPRVVITIQEAT